MTTNIVDKDGVISDFQGDAAMGFWGWPLSTDDQMEQAARARRWPSSATSPVPPRKAATRSPALPVVSVSPTGGTIAGKLGTLDQFKVGVFGPVVNLASRLESMTKLFRVPILVDESVAQHLTSGRNSHWVRDPPPGPGAALRPAQGAGGERIVAPGRRARHYGRDRRDYEAALEAFLASRWADASRLLDRLPHNAGLFVKEFMDHHAQKPPAEWNGVIALENK